MLPDDSGSYGGITLTKPVERVHVTTPATREASSNRRTAQANFKCPVPGCGSTFTRHFNLRGHIRSHNEERPFKCKWPGCDKGFARQHDCKRHEALHLNIRPYTCEGCQKTFARMDALNRHCKSVLDCVGSALTCLQYGLKVEPSANGSRAKSPRPQATMVLQKIGRTITASWYNPGMMTAINKEYPCD
ncbi:hypothetical protein B0J17DRAFT_567200 [Rhizoctonia solani]|nr:hypothetical protein B0J17DRAFT_567200 [Rhizoctonia solani]